MALAAGCGCVAIWFGDPTTPGGPLPVCPTKLLFGVSCPGCGSLRMIYSLQHGDIVAAIGFNVVTLLALALLSYAYAAWTYTRLTGRPVRTWQHHSCSAPITLVVVLVWFVVYPPRRRDPER
ncbi:DUF2752 domain-containing protein [Mycobacterium sp. DL99]|uniref:DUF2752 domain-containing protein n=1 Tax=Mycobacterium sp. DL99 TaxID=2528957 RepID=UPI00256FF43E|nr:DUF2752 domain-containing protein [Mycobacterium sp. DL99]